MGCPQSGIANAGVVYEAPVEGDITRLMGIFEDYKDLERIGSVRSCRDYYIFYANEFDAIYAHYGQSAFALPYFEQHLIDNLNGVKLGKICYFRSTDRKAPHNAYTTYDLLQQGIGQDGIPQRIQRRFMMDTMCLYLMELKTHFRRVHPHRRYILIILQ